jgi:sugar phosphate isomerase/epimerase
MGSDPKAIFKKLADIGFKNIETATYTDDKIYGFRPKEFKSLIEDLGMNWISHHVPGAPFSMLFEMPANPTAEQVKQFEQMKQFASQMKAPNLTDNLQKVVDSAAEGGVKYLVCAATAISSLDKIKAAVVTFSKAGELCKKAGIQFAYHNHSSEWDPIEGTSAYNVIMSQTDKELVKMELDLGWAAVAKKNAADLFRANPGRFPLFHLKDFNLSANTMVPVGEGDVDFGAAFAEADLAGMKYYFIEQDNAKSMDDVIVAFNNVRKKLKL